MKIWGVDDFKVFVARCRWREAVTYRERAPHEYTVLVSEKQRKDFVRAAYFIRQRGFVGTFWGRQYWYYEVDGYRYWTMDFPLSKTDLVNRCKLGHGCLDEDGED